MEKLQEKIYQALGQASVCWSETPTGIFDEKEANKIAENLINEINIHYDPVNAVTDQIKNDPELFVAWRDNIAMSFKDQVQPLYKHFIDGQPVTALDPFLVHNLANQAAINFLNLLCDIKPQSVEDDVPHIS